MNKKIIIRSLSLIILLAPTSCTYLAVMNELQQEEIKLRNDHRDILEKRKLLEEERSRLITLKKSRESDLTKLRGKNRKAENALRQRLSSSSGSAEQVAKLKNEIDQNNQKIRQIQKEIANLEQQIIQGI